MGSSPRQPGPLGEPPAPELDELLVAMAAAAKLREEGLDPKEQISFRGERVSRQTAWEWAFRAEWREAARTANQELLGRVEKTWGLA